MTLYLPAGVDDAHATWGANCGPCALSAILQRPLEVIRRIVRDTHFERRRYMNFGMMMDALLAARVPYIPIYGSRLPARGLVWIQWFGPWTEAGASPRTATRHTHWVAKDGDMIYDANLDGWVTRAAWEGAVPPLIREHVRGATGIWAARKGFEVSP